MKALNVARLLPGLAFLAVLGAASTDVFAGGPDGPSVITYQDSSGHQRIYAFAIGSNGHLVVNYWADRSWHWEDLGLPPDTTEVKYPAAITYLDESGHRLIYVFARASNHHLVVNYGDEEFRYWDDRGFPQPLEPLPECAGVAKTQAALSFLDESGHPRIDVYATDACGHVRRHFWDGSNWSWGTSGSVYSPISAITYLDQTGEQRIYLFAAIAWPSGVELIVNGIHYDQVGMPGDTGYSRYTAAVTYFDPGFIIGQFGQRTLVFNADYNGHLRVTYFDDPPSSPTWSDHGVPPGATAISWEQPAPITYTDAAGNRRHYVFMTSDNGHLVVNYSDGSWVPNWYWADLGHPSRPATAVSNPAAITYLDAAGQQQICVFAKDNAGRLVMNYSDGAGWHWAVQGTL